MPDTPYTQKYNFQQRGPQRSDDYNEMREQQLADLVYLYNKLNQVDFDIDTSFSVIGKNLMMLSRMLDNFETRIQVLEDGFNRLGFKSSSQIDVDRFDGVPAYAIVDADTLNYDSKFGFFTLPKLQASSISKIKFGNDDGTSSVSSYLEMNVVTDETSADSATATIDTSSPFYSVQGLTGKIWERNVIRSNINANGAILNLFIKIPEDMAINANVNNIQFSPFPMYGVDILEISYTTSQYAKLNSSETWTPLNVNDYHYNNNSAVGFVPPGAWNGDTILNSGMKSFYFDPIPITAINIKMRQRNYIKEGSYYVYSYGLSNLDIRLDNFMATGRTIIRFDAPNGDTISSVDAVIPRAWNIAANQLDDCVSTRVIWETSYDSGTYTLTPVPFSNRVWVEITLNETFNSGTPVLSDLIIEYS